MKLADEGKTWRLLWESAKKRCPSTEMTYALHRGNEFVTGGNILFSAA